MRIGSLFCIFILQSSAPEWASKRSGCKFEWIFRQFKAKVRRFSGAKSRAFNAEMAEKMPSDNTIFCRVRYYFAAFAQLSFKPTVRLNTGSSAVESLSLQK